MVSLGWLHIDKTIPDKDDQVITKQLTISRVELPQLFLAPARPFNVRIRKASNDGTSVCVIIIATDPFVLSEA